MEMVDVMELIDQVHYFRILFFLKYKNELLNFNIESAKRTTVHYTNIHLSIDLLLVVIKRIEEVSICLKDSHCPKTMFYF